MAISISVASSLRQSFARTEDGDYLVVEDFSVQATFDDGTRYEHQVRFAGSTPRNEDGFAYAVCGDHQAAERLAARVEAHLAAGGSLDLSRWVEIEAAYGSDAYVRSGCEAERAYRERLAG